VAQGRCIRLRCALAQHLQDRVAGNQVNEQKHQRNHQPDDRDGKNEASENLLHGLESTINQGSGIRGQGSALSSNAYTTRNLLAGGRDLDTIELIGSTMGLGFLAGVRLYATILTLGLAIRFGWFHPGPMAAQLRILAEPMVLVAAGVACAIEFFADKVAWVDSIWDSFHAFIRPIGAVVVSAAVLGSFDPVLKVTLIILCGGVAFASHSSKAATRLLVNHSPEPFSNIAISLAEDALVPFGVWLSLRHPQIVLGLVLAFLVVFFWAAPKVFRAVRLQFVAFMIWLGVGEHAHQNGASEAALTGMKPDVAGAIKVVARHAAPIVASDAQEGPARVAS
jgi:hypothetical protein